MATQHSINNITKQGYWIDILVSDDGLITAGIYTKPDSVSGMSAAVLEPTNETGRLLDNVMKSLEMRFNKHLKEQGK